MKKCLIVFNPTSGHAVSGKVLEKFREKLDKRNYSVKIISTEYAGHATEIVRDSEKVDIIFSIGGDGTLNEVVRGNYLRDDKIPICPISAGTCNDVATMFGYGKDPVRNLELALDGGEVNEMDIGVINDKPFAYVVGVGSFMNIPYETKTIEKKKSGYLAYIKAALPEIINKLKRYKVEVEVDGERKDGNYSLIMVSNSNHIAGVDGFHKNVCLDDGEMEVLLCTAKNKREFVQSFASYLIRGKSERIISLRGHDVSIKFLDKPEKNWCVDGEKLDYDGHQYTIKVGKRIPFVTALKNKVKVKRLFRENHRIKYS